MSPLYILLFSVVFIGFTCQLYNFYSCIRLEKLKKDNQILLNEVVHMNKDISKFYKEDIIIMNERMHEIKIQMDLIMLNVPHMNHNISNLLERVEQIELISPVKASN